VRHREVEEPRHALADAQTALDVVLDERRQAPANRLAIDRDDVVPSDERDAHARVGRALHAEIVQVRAPVSIDDRRTL
jgi:hypothetical protein